MAESESYHGLELREAFGRALVEIGHEVPNVVVLDADLNTSSKTVIFKKAFPDRFLQFGIAEQNLFGVAAGLALEGFIPFPSTFAAFVARRGLDQIAMSISYPNLNVKIPGSYVGVPTSRAGASHNCIEDIAVLRSLPNMRVADPGDSVDLRAIIRTAVATEGPVYFRITRMTLPDIFPSDHQFEWGRGVVLREGGDVTLFGTGVMTSMCMQAAERLAEESIKAEVVHMASIKPIDRELILQSTSKTGCAVAAENGTVLGGFGSAVAEVLGDVCPVPFHRIGVQDRWVDSGGIAELLEDHGMDAAHIAAAALEVIKRK